eukprot:TRINITY_DN7347_c0_g1_i1.p1 TRINITY_DN7347_c0_g1~~TRINITY_DN7347_c0_g1_i1.p1  ORF type:complete len:890 (+),score=198.47 TRINITY_DN7347_c0_g1_i1:62-2731(+)
MPQPYTSGPRVDLSPPRMKRVQSRREVPLNMLHQQLTQGDVHQQQSPMQHSPVPRHINSYQQEMPPQPSNQIYPAPPRPSPLVHPANTMLQPMYEPKQRIDSLSSAVKMVLTDPTLEPTMRHALNEDLHVLKVMKEQQPVPSATPSQPMPSQQFVQQSQVVPSQPMPSQQSQVTPSFVQQSQPVQSQVAPSQPIPSQPVQPEIIYQEKIVEIPVEKLVEVPVEVPVERVVEVEVERRVEVQVPVEKIVEKIVEVPVERIVEVPVERIVEVPVERIVEKIVEVPVERIVEVEVERTVEVPVDRIVEKVVEVPVEIERVVEVPVEKIVEREVEVPVERITERVVEREVPVEKIVEVFIDREVPVEVERVVEKIVQVPVEVERIVEVIKEVPVERIVEKIIEVPTPTMAVTSTEYTSTHEEGPVQPMHSRRSTSGCTPPCTPPQDLDSPGKLRMSQLSPYDPQGERVSTHSTLPVQEDSLALSQGAVSRNTSMMQSAVQQPSRQVSLALPQPSQTQLVTQEASLMQSSRETSVVQSQPPSQTQLVTKEASLVQSVAQPSREASVVQPVSVQLQESSAMVQSPVRDPSMHGTSHYSLSQLPSQQLLAVPSRPSLVPVEASSQVFPSQPFSSHVSSMPSEQLLETPSRPLFENQPNEPAEVLLMSTSSSLFTPAAKRAMQVNDSEETSVQTAGACCSSYDEVERLQKLLVASEVRVSELNRELQMDRTRVRSVEVPVVVERHVPVVQPVVPTPRPLVYGGRPEETLRNISPRRKHGVGPPVVGLLPSPREIAVREEAKSRLTELTGVNAAHAVVSARHRAVRGSLSPQNRTVSPQRNRWSSPISPQPHREPNLPLLLRQIERRAIELQHQAVQPHPLLSNTATTLSRTLEAFQK